MCKGRGPRFACQTLGSVVGSKQSGIFVHTRGVLTCENDNIFQNAKAGVQVKNTGQVFATKNVIRKNGHVGIWIYEGGNGSLIHNDLRFNERGGLKLEKDAGSVRLGPSPAGQRAQGIMVAMSCLQAVLNLHSNG